MVDTDGLPGDGTKSNGLKKVWKGNGKGKKHYTITYIT